MRMLLLEIVCWAAGLGLAGLYGWARADAALHRTADLARFEAGLQTDSSLWSASRVQAYKASSHLPSGELLGVLSIPSVALKAPLYGDTRPLHLNRGVGLIEKTARPGAGGNLGIAGHRDGFFRALETIRVGERIEVLTRDRAYHYRIVRTAVVDRADTDLLQPTEQPVVTLVTCHPFRFVGHAPRRFVVRGMLVATRGREA